MDKKANFRWETSSCAPKDYPVMVISGILTYPKEGGMDVDFDPGTTNYWGSTNGSSMGRSSSGIPDGVGIEWYSYAEDKFYSGFFDLPADTIRHLFEAGFVQADAKIPGSYTHIVVGMAPRGVVSVWLYGDGTVTEVGNFKAEETQMDIRDAFPSYMQREEDWKKEPKEVQEEWRYRLLSADYPEVLQRVQENAPIPEGIWDKLYREKIDSRVRVNFADSAAILDMMTMAFLNGEQESLMYDRMHENAFKARPRFKEITFKWSSGRELIKSNMELNTEEVLEAYRLVSADEPADRQYELRVEVNASNNHIRIYMQAVGTEYRKEVELEKARIRIYPLSESLRFKFDVFRDEYEDSFDLRMLRKDRNNKN